jgi:hypothetical protein
MLEDNQALATESLEFSKSVSGEPYLAIENEPQLAGAPQDLLRLAQWAFGPDGLPILRIIAYGDFSYNGRYAEYTKLLCRKQPNSSKDKNSKAAILQTERKFKRLAENDMALQDLVRDNLDMLGACAVDNIMPAW